jgi:hypothetical protein
VMIIIFWQSKTSSINGKEINEEACKITYCIN